jgi:hypothetical protein
VVLHMTYKVCAALLCRILLPLGVLSLILQLRNQLWY